MKVEQRLSSGLAIRPAAREVHLVRDGRKSEVARQLTGQNLCAGALGHIFFSSSVGHPARSV